MPGRSARPRGPLLSEPAAGPIGPERWGEDVRYLWGVDLYNHGYFWEAHEVWESAWYAAVHDPQHHVYLQGLIQCAAACLKGALGDRDSARRISGRALERLERVGSQGGGQYMGLDLAQFCSAFRNFVAENPVALEHRPRITLRRAQDASCR